MKIIKLWNRLWFQDGDPYALGVYRSIVFLSYVVLAISQQSLMASEVICRKFSPISFYDLLSIPCSQSLFYTVFGCSVIASVLAAVGVAYRFTGKIAAFSAVFVLGYQYNFSEVYHGTHMIAMILLILGISKAGDAFTPNKVHSETELWHYYWPLQLSKYYVVYVYLIVGLEKLYQSGWEWAFSENLWLIVFTSPFHGAWSGWFLGLSMPVIYFIAFYSLFVCELMAPLALLKNIFGYFMFFNWLGFHIGVSLILGGHWTFYSQMACAAVFLLPLIQSPRNRQF